MQLSPSRIYCIVLLHDIVNFLSLLKGMLRRLKRRVTVVLMLSLSADDRSSALPFKDALILDIISAPHMQVGLESVVLNNILELLWMHTVIDVEPISAEA